MRLLEAGQPEVALHLAEDRPQRLRTGHGERAQRLLDAEPDADGVAQRLDRLADRLLDLAAAPLGALPVVPRGEQQPGARGRERHYRPAEEELGEERGQQHPPAALAGASSRRPTPSAPGEARRRAIQPARPAGRSFGVLVGVRLGLPAGEPAEYEVEAEPEGEAQHDVHGRLLPGAVTRRSRRVRGSRPQAAAPPAGDGCRSTRAGRPPARRARSRRPGRPPGP